MHGITHLLHETSTPAPWLLSAGTYDAAEGENKPLHQHTCWELVYVRTGHIGCPLGGEFYEGEPGALLVTPPATPHTELAWTAWSCFYVGIEASADLPWPRLCLDDIDSTYAHLCAALVREWTKRSDDREEMLSLLVKQLAVHLRRSYECPLLPHGERIVREVERLFQERLATSLIMADVAREVGVSPTMLREYFGRTRGQAPLARLCAMRVERAITLVHTSDLTIEAIAPLCGFDSASHLSRHVKRMTGKSPGTFRPGCIRFGNTRTVTTT